MRNLYEVLGIIDETVDVEEIKKAYRKLIKRHHPDRGGDPAKFKEVQEAWDVLSDPKKRAHYDETGEVPQSESKTSAEVWTCLSRLFTESINETKKQESMFPFPSFDSLNKVDLLGKMRKMLETGKAQGHVSIKDFQTTKKELDALKDNFVTTDEVNIMRDIVLAQIRQCDIQIKELEGHITMFGKCLDLLKSYTYRMSKETKLSGTQYKYLPMPKSIFGDDK